MKNEMKKYWKALITRHRMKILLFFFTLLVFCRCNPAKNATVDGQSDTIYVKAGNDFSMEMPSNISTGYGWELADSIDVRFIRLVKKEYKETVDKKIGTPGIEIWTFHALQKGNSTISFVYGRPWIKTTPKDAQRRVYRIVIE